MRLYAACQAPASIFFRRCGPEGRADGEISVVSGGKICYNLRMYLKTPNAPGRRAFSRCAAPFSLEIRQYSCEKMSCAT